MQRKNNSGQNSVTVLSEKYTRLFLELAKRELPNLYYKKICEGLRGKKTKEQIEWLKHYIAGIQIKFQQEEDKHLEKKAEFEELRVALIEIRDYSKKGDELQFKTDEKNKLLANRYELNLEMLSKQDFVRHLTEEYYNVKSGLNDYSNGFSADFKFHFERFVDGFDSIEKKYQRFLDPTRLHQSKTNGAKNFLSPSKEQSLSHSTNKITSILNASIANSVGKSQALEGFHSSSSSSGENKSSLEVNSECEAPHSSSKTPPSDNAASSRKTYGDEDIFGFDVNLGFGNTVDLFQEMYSKKF